MFKKIFCFHKHWEVFIDGRANIVFKCLRCGKYRDMNIVNKKVINGW